MFEISKTTINGILSLMMTVLTSVLAYQIPSALMTPEVTHKWLWVTVVGNLTLAILRAVMGWLQKDA